MPDLTRIASQFPLLSFWKEATVGSTMDHGIASSSEIYSTVLFQAKSHKQCVTFPTTHHHHHQTESSFANAYTRCKAPPTCKTWVRETEKFRNLEFIQKPLTLQQQHNLMNDIPNRLRLGIDHKISLLRLLIRIVHAREALDLAPPRARIHAALICLLGVSQRSRNMDEEEAAVLGDGVAGLATAVCEGGDGSGDDGGAGLGELGGDEGDALDVLVAVVAGEAELGRELGAHGVAEEQGDGAAALLVKGDFQGAGHGVLAAVLVACQEDGEALGEARGVGLPEDFDHFGVGEPFRDVFARAQPVAEFGAADVERADAGGDFVFRPVFVAVGEVGHHLEGDDFDAQLVSVFFHGVLGVVGAVELFAFGVLAGSGVVSSDDEMCGSVVLSDDGVPDRFSWSTHAHCQREETEDGHAVRVAREDSFVHPDTCEVIDVARLRQSDYGVNEDVGLTSSSGADGQFSVGAVHWVSSLECDHPRPSEFLEMQT